MTLDSATRAIRCLTCGVPGAAFLRVMHLPSGDYLLTGPAKFTDIVRGRRVEAEVWYMRGKPGSKPVPLGERISEGIAISRTRSRIARTVTNRCNEVERSSPAKSTWPFKQAGAGLGLLLDRF